MDTSLYVAMARQITLARELDLVAQNIANMNTTGYRAERVMFDEALSKVAKNQKVAFVIDRADYMVAEAGAFQQTGNPLDLAIDGDGWFQVQTSRGVMYTRDGRFKINGNGILVTNAGNPVLGEGGGLISLPSDDGIRVEIAKDGSITVYTENLGIPDDQQFGKVGLVRFDNLQNMLRQGDTLYRTNEQPQPANRSQLMQGMLEASNVEPIIELTRMLELSKAHASAGRFIDNGDRLKRDAIRRLGDARG